MSAHYKGAAVPQSLITRLRGPRDMGWEPKETILPPEIQIEAADELQRLENQMTLMNSFLVSKGLFVEFWKSVY